MTTTRKITRRPMINADATIENVESLVADGVHPTQIAARTGYKHVDHLIRMLRRKQRDDLAHQFGVRNNNPAPPEEKEGAGMTRMMQHFSGDWMLISPSGQIEGRFASRETAEDWLALVESAPVQCPADCIAGEVDHNPEGVARWGQCHLCGGDGWVATCPQCHGTGCSTCSNGLIPADRYDDLAAS